MARSPASSSSTARGLAPLLLLCLVLGQAAGDAFVPLSSDLATAVKGPTAPGRLQLLDEEPEEAEIVPADFVQEANAWRAEVGAPPLEWDETVAKVAEAWAKVLEEKQCEMVHSDAAWSAKAYLEAGGQDAPLGENLAWACCDSPPTQTGKEVVDMWASEKKDYTFGPTGDECTAKPDKEVGHYTQLVWAKSEKIGCGMAQCGDKGTVWVCNFFPAGNTQDELPFCSANVPEGMSECKGLDEAEDAEEGIPCGKPEGECGFEGDCCSCEDEEQNEEEEGKEDVEEGAKEEKKGEEEGDKEEAEEGKEEKEEGKVEEEEGEEEEGETVELEIELAGVDESDFDKVKFAEVLAEALGVPLYDIEVGEPSSGSRRRLLSSALKVPVKVKCEGAKCQELKSKANGLVCNGQLAASLSEAFGTTVRTPECPSDSSPSPSSSPPGSKRPTGRITFPDAFPNSVRHWLIIGLLLMALGAAVVFFFVFVPNRPLPMPGVLVFMVCAVAMCSYYCMWAGVGVQFKTTDVTPRVIFFAKYVDWVLTVPMLLFAVGLIAEADSSMILALVGNGVLFVICGFVGSTLIAPYKYFWWVVGMVFYAIVLLLLFRTYRSHGINSYNQRTVRTLVLIILIGWSFYPIIWITGSEGTGALGLSQEVALTTLLDCVTKVVSALIVVTSPYSLGLSKREEEESIMHSQQYSSVV